MPKDPEVRDYMLLVKALGENQKFGKLYDEWNALLIKLRESNRKRLPLERRLKQLRKLEAIEKKVAQAGKVARKRLRKIRAKISTDYNAEDYRRSIKRLIEKNIPHYMAKAARNTRALRKALNLEVRAAAEAKLRGKIMKVWNSWGVLWTELQRRCKNVKKLPKDKRIKRIHWCGTRLKILDKEAGLALRKLKKISGQLRKNQKLERDAIKG